MSAPGSPFPPSVSPDSLQPHEKPKWRRFLPIVVPIGALLLGLVIGNSTNDPTNSAEYKELSAQLAAVEGERDTCSTEVSDLEKEGARLSDEVTALEGEVDRLESEAAAATVAAVPAPTETTAPETTAPAAAEPAAAVVVVPDGVGKDYQTAQDLWRSAGLVVLMAEDGLGLDRIAIIDSNWVVLAQDIPAGSTVPDGTSITATIVKFTDL